MNTQAQTFLQAFAFLSTIACIVIGTLASIAFAIARRERLVRACVAVTGIVVSVYALSLLVAGARSDDRMLGPGEPKVFCELDCHLAYTVSRARVAPTIGPARAAGVFYVVTVRTHFDEASISSQRGDGALWPNPRRLRVVDSVGRAWAPSVDGERALTSLAQGGTPIDTPLHPGESYETTYAFDVPANVVAPRLEITEDDGVTRLLIGHENSPFHGKTTFALGRGFALR